jgi:hypothetical protein
MPSRGESQFKFTIGAINSFLCYRTWRCDWGHGGLAWIPAHFGMDEGQPILGADCPACDTFVPALPISRENSRWKWYMRCPCGVIFFTEKIYTKVYARSDTVEA